MNPRVRALSAREHRNERHLALVREARANHEYGRDVNLPDPPVDQTEHRVALAVCLLAFAALAIAGVLAAVRLW